MVTDDRKQDFGFKLQDSGGDDELLSHWDRGRSGQTYLSYLVHNVHRRTFDSEGDLHKEPLGRATMSSSYNASRSFVSIGMFIIDEFSFADKDGKPTGKTMAAQASLLCTTATTSLDMNE